MTGFVPVVPRYGQASLPAVLPRVLADLLGDGEGPRVSSAVVVLVDGLGARLLERRGGHAPFLRSLLPAGSVVDCGFPTTTATSMGSFGTGLAPGAHGLVGYEVLDPATDRVFNELSWEHGPAPRRWQPHPTLFERAVADGVAVTRIGPGFFDGSGLTEAALRGGRFVAAGSLADRVDAAVRTVREQPRSLVYLYWGDLDKVGHVHGCGSWQWGDELTAVDGELARLARCLPPGTSLHVTADHGMVDVPDSGRLELADAPDLEAGVRLVAGEPRSLQLHVRPGALDDVVAAWRGRFGAGAAVRTRAEAVAERWFGDVRPEVAARIGDVVVAMGPGLSVVDSRRQRPQLVALRGVHGSLTDDEVAVPWLTVTA